MARRLERLKNLFFRLVLGRRVTEGISPAIYNQLVARLYHTRPFSLVVTGVGLAVLGLVTAERARDSILAVLTALGCCALAAGARALKVTKEECILASTATALKAERRLAILSILSSAAVGALCARGLLATNDPVVHLMIFSVAMAATVSAMRNHSRPRIVFAQLTVLIVPATAALSALGANYWLLMAGSWILTYVSALTTKSLYHGLRGNLLKDAQISSQKVRFEAALDNMAQGLCMFDATGRVLVANGRYLQIYGFSADVIRPGTSLRDLLRHSIQTGNRAAGDLDELVADFRHKFASGSSATFHESLQNGRTIAISYQPMEGGGWVTTHEDITDRKAAEARISYLARHDSLTELANRTVFKETLEAALVRVGRGEELAVLCLDLDRFKSVNDTLGHATGDQLLQQVAVRLEAALRETDLVARLGGDEFAIIALGAPQPTSATILADRVINALARPFDLAEHVVSIGCSIGISIAPVDGCEADQLLRNADLALYRAKADGRGQHRFFSSDMDERMQARRRLELDLRGALTRGEFELVYQPLVTVEGGAISGFEALLRWNHPERGLIMPDEFIPLAEETGLIVPLGEWVLRDACATAAAWPADVRVAVNLSPVQFRGGDIVTSVAIALSASGLASHRLELEITEGLLLSDTEETMTKLHRLRDLGARIAMDDFGTGYSSLSYLRSFPFDKIKIDRSFIKDINSDPEAMAIVRAVAGLGKSLGISTTAEGIETREQFERLRDDGCTEVQGYLLGRPMAAVEASTLIGSQTRGSQAA